MIKKKQEAEEKKGEESKKEPPRRQGIALCSKDIRPLLSSVLGKRGLIQADILSFWEEILGSALSQGVFPDSIAFSKAKNTNGAILSVKAISGAFAIEFESRKAQIQERINTFFGYDAITEIRITQGFKKNVPPKKKKKYIRTLTEQEEQAIQTLTNSIENTELREATLALGKIIEATKKD